MGELRLRQPQSRVVPFFDGPVTRRYLTREQTRGLTEVGALAPSEREGELKYYTDFTSALQVENLISSAWQRSKRSPVTLLQAFPRHRRDTYQPTSYCT